jgi:hypothetical protein
MTTARPRNQHYLHEIVIVWRPLIYPTSKRRQRRTGTLRVRRLEHRRQIALQLDLELSFYFALAGVRCRVRQHDVICVELTFHRPFSVEGLA